VFEQFKETEVGPIPVDWDVVRLGEVVRLTLGQSPPSSTYNTDGIGLPFLQGKAEFGVVFPLPDRWCSDPERTADPGSILISVRAPVGDVNIAKERYCIGRGLAAINGEDLVENWFLFYLLIFAKTHLEDKATGSTFKSINKSILQSFPIPLPSLGEQRRIAGALRVIQDAIAAQEDVIAAVQETKRSLMERLFRYGSGAEPAPTKETEIGEIPEHWKLLELQQVLEDEDGIKRGPWGGSIRKDMFVDSGYKVYEQGNVISGDFSLGRYFIDERKFQELEGFSVRSGDILLTAAGTIGRVAVVPEGVSKGIINQALIRLRPKKDLLSTSCFVYLLTRYREQGIWQGMSHGAVLKNLSSVRVLRTIPTPVPPLDEQQRIAAILARIDQKNIAEEQRKAALEALFQSTLQQLMTGQIRLV
jgi:type I restriction enzyme S subunit